MKKTNFYWIIAAFCIMRIAGMQLPMTASFSEEEGKEPKTFTFSMKDAVVSGRWMR